MQVKKQREENRVKRAMKNIDINGWLIQHKKGIGLIFSKTNAQYLYLYREKKVEMRDFSVELYVFYNIFLSIFSRECRSSLTEPY